MRPILKWGLIVVSTVGCLVIAGFFCALMMGQAIVESHAQ